MGRRGYGTKVYERTQGDKVWKLEKAIAYTAEAQAGVDDLTADIGLKAERVLATHHHDGHAEIEVSRRKSDGYITLNDDRGLGAAMTIEFGRKGDTVYQSGPLEGQPVTPMDAVAPLRLALGMGKTRVGARRIAGKRGRIAEKRRKR